VTSCKGFDVFLALTADQRYWPEDGARLLVGEWCDPLSEGLGELMDPPWPDAEAFDQACRSANDYYEQSLKSIAKALNGIHGSSHSDLYWRIVVGPWLLHHIHSLYDRYCYLRHAFGENRVTTVAVMRKSLYVYPADHSEQKSALQRDGFNLQMFGELIERMRLPSMVVVEEKAHALEQRNEVSQSVRRVPGIRSLWNEYGTVVWDRALAKLIYPEGKVGIYRLYWTVADVVRLLRSAKGQIRPMSFRPMTSLVSEAVRDGALREQLGAGAHGDEFLRLALELTALYLPSLYLENYKEARAKSLAGKKPFPETIISSVGYFGSEHFKLYAAEAAESGTELRGMQHGGGYGMAQCFPHEEHERAITSRYYAWGWGGGKKSKVMNLPRPKLKVRTVGVRQRKGRLLFVSSSSSLYRLRFSSLGTWKKAYDFDRTTFVSSLTTALRRETVVRLYPSSYGREDEAGMRKKYPELTFDCTQPALDAMKGSEVVVIDHCITSMIEALILNIPTILFWDRSLWPLRDEANRHVDAMEDVGMFRSSARETAEVLNGGLENVQTWWRNDAVQRVREDFVRDYGYCRADWAEVVAREFSAKRDLVSSTTYHHC
tara:strand:+ start:1096 stop:2904 length:1809 start_codon:yes stop_codon:yes gene_type:complete